jgi:hypothetical protein
MGEEEEGEGRGKGGNPLGVKTATSPAQQAGSQKGGSP